MSISNTKPINMDHDDNEVYVTEIKNRRFSLLVGEMDAGKMSVNKSISTDIYR